MSGQVKEKLQKKSLYAYRRQNTYDYIRSAVTPLVYFKLTPSGIGKMACLRTKLQTIIGSVFWSPDSKELNPCFDYLIRRLAYFEAVNFNQKTQYRTILGNEMSSDIENQLHQAAIKERVEAIVKELKDDQSSQNYPLRNQRRRAKRLDLFNNKIDDFRNQLREQLKQYNASKRESTSTQPSAFLLSDEYIEEIIRNIDKIELLRQSQQFIKYSIFEKKNKEYFEVALKVDKQSRKIEIKINRPSSEIDPLLTTLQDMVRMRDGKSPLQAENNRLIKDIFHQINQYEIRNSSETNRAQYEWLHPSTIIFDQISLIPKLSFDPLVLDLLGVKNRPMSVENRIAFSPTPTGFDYFRSLPEFHPHNNLILNDPFYGNIQMYDSDRNRLTHDQLTQIQEERKELMRVKEEMITWRFLLMSYYLRHSVQFGFKEQMPSNQAKTNHYIEKLSAFKQSVKVNARHLQPFLGSANIELHGFDFKMSDVAEYLSIQNEDSVLQSHKYLIIRKYFQVRTTLIKEFIRLLINDKIFGLILNIKKYIFIYLALAIEILEQARRFIEVQIQKPKERKKLRVYLQKELRRLNSQNRNNFGYLHTTFERIEQYCQRDPRTDTQARFAQEDEVGIKIITFLTELNNIFIELQANSDTLNQFEAKDNLLAEDRHTYKQFIQTINKTVKDNYQKVKEVLKEFVFSQLKLKHKNGPHKLNDQATKNIRPYLVIYTNRLEYLVLVYLSLDETNFVTYDTLVIPLFRIDDSERRFQIPNDTRDFSVEKSNLEIIKGLIEVEKLRPARMEHLGTNISREFRMFVERNGQINRQSIEAQTKIDYNRVKIK